MYMNNTSNEVWSFVFESLFMIWGICWITSIVLNLSGVTVSYNFIGVVLFRSYTFLWHAVKLKWKPALAKVPLLRTCEWVGCKFFHLLYQKYLKTSVSSSLLKSSIMSLIQGALVLFMDLYFKLITFLIICKVLFYIKDLQNSLLLIGSLGLCYRS